MSGKNQHRTLKIPIIPHRQAEPDAGGLLEYLPLLQDGSGIGAEQEQIIIEGDLKPAQSIKGCLSPIVGIGIIPGDGSEFRLGIYPQKEKKISLGKKTGN